MILFNYYCTRWLPFWATFLETSQLKCLKSECKKKYVYLKKACMPSGYNKPCVCKMGIVNQLQCLTREETKQMVLGGQKGEVKIRTMA